MYSTPSGQASEMSTNEPNRTAMNRVLNSRATPSGPSPIAALEAVAPDAASLAGVLPVADVPGGAVATAVVVTAASVVTVNLNDPLPAGVPSGLLTFQATTQVPFGSAPGTGTVSVS